MTGEERHERYVEVILPQLDRLCALIVSASSVDDRSLEQSRYQDLLRFYEEQVELGHWHPALADAVAGFTAVRNPAGALPYYRLALEQARLIADDQYPILISMAETLFELGLRADAEAALHEGTAEALANGDHESVQEADRVLREASA